VAAFLLGNSRLFDHVNLVAAQLDWQDTIGVPANAKVDIDNRNRIICSSSDNCAGWRVAQHLGDFQNRQRTFPAARINNIPFQRAPALSQMSTSSKTSSQTNENIVSVM
jgi:hypothetical protein